MLKQKINQATKTKLSQTLRTWLPILQVGIEDLKESLNEMIKDNPFASVSENKATRSDGKKSFDHFYKNSVSDTLEALSLSKKSVYELLEEQIIPPLFPTAKSQEIALKIIECLNNEGYFEYDEELLKDFSKEEVERIRQRFKFLDPVGVGALNFKEALLFSLENEQDLDEELDEFCRFLITDFDNIKDYVKEPLYKQALAVIKKFSTPPFLEYFEDSRAIVPDIFIYREDGEIKIKINDEYYPEIHIETDNLEHEFLSSYIKEAKNLIDALEMRKATLYKVGLMIIEHQYDFFVGKEIKPMKLSDLAEDLQRNSSTISRAIANKYLSFEGGLVPLKNFFTTAVDDEGETSNATIKEYITELIKKEDRKKPLSDEKLLQLAQKEFSSMQIGRRTIAKYRIQLGIASSSDRKKLYELS
ncbi:RNA polymerase factor sigma-54 [Campylobacter sp. MIT 99-7217]|uniref:RNA polymerase factor sigma-54 n=1 Tax=Campylobacter sp. MIT 99-7217 TaxID=535091 RepID=UPI00115AA114|nr:RNA polymerase factor sigma-54 [Campylobacter sp. MIT 99-7217]TQR34703.1 RNA polymerase factor sigma-54 [Campylobacter sp. MIT 99-7217]